jgi:nicotinic acid mononucleotide adenylyltransferase
MARTSVLDIELNRPPPSYTVQTLDALRAWCPRAEWSLVIGADVFLGLRDWYRAERLLELASLIVLARTGGGDPLPEAPEAWAALLPNGWKDRVKPGAGNLLVDDQGRKVMERLNTNLPAMSSSKIREDHLLEAVAPGARELLRHYLDARNSGTEGR